MPRADNEWGEWDENQYTVKPRPAWLEKILRQNESASIKQCTKPTDYPKVPSLPPQEIYLPSLKDFRCWYVWARETGQHERYLQQIEKLAVAFKHVTPGAEADVNLTNPGVHLSAENTRDMRNDQRSYQELLNNFLYNAKVIVNRQGRHLVDEGKSLFQYSSKTGEYVISYYPASDKLTVKRNNYLLAHRQAGKVDVGDKFVVQRDVVFLRHITTRR